MKLREAWQQLPERRDAEVLLCHVLQCDRSYLLAYDDRVLSSQEQQAFEQLVLRRRAGEPIAYLLGEREFWSLPLAVNASTLIPRPETELLVETALQLCQAVQARVLDLGTGTGAIALALAHERPRWEVMAVDVVPDAVALAEHNARQTGLQNVQCRQSDWFAAVNGEVFDLVVANPPYIADNDPHLEQGDVRFEPRTALVSGVEGLDAVRHIVEQAPSHLVTGGWLLLEHGFTQGGAVRSLLQAAGFAGVSTYRDLAGQERVTVGYRS